MRTIDDEADALRDVREHVGKAIKALPNRRGERGYWLGIDCALDDVKERIDRALKEIGA